MNDLIIVLNIGSSNCKLSIYSRENMNEPIVNDTQYFTCEERDLMIIDCISGWMLKHKDCTVQAIAYRVVHGGTRYRHHCIIDASVLDALERLCPLAPSHMQPTIAVIKKLMHHFNKSLHIACFDTAFHMTMPPLAKLLPLDRQLNDEQIQRYGFHGLSYANIAMKMMHILPVKHQSRVAVAHLGNGSSVCALRQGKSIDTSMSFTALGGMMMGTRSGDIDPGIILYLLKEKAWTVPDVEKLLHENSGLIGVSTISNDMRVLCKSEKKTSREAVELYCLQAAQHIARLAVSLSGLDAIIFTAGIGENSALVREKICYHLKFLGVEIDSHKNESFDPALHALHARTSKMGLYKIPTDEAGEMARACWSLLEKNE